MSISTFERRGPKDRRNNEFGFKLSSEQDANSINNKRITRVGAPVDTDDVLRYAH